MGGVFNYMSFKTFGFVLLLVSVILFVNFAVQQEGSEDNMYKINVSESVSGVLNNPIAQVYSFFNFSLVQEVPEENIYKINESDAVSIISNDSIAQGYMSENFVRPEWRVTNVSMLVNSTYDFNGSEYLWDVKIMERTCSCSSVKELYVIEGQVSPITGEILNITTGLVMESEYDKKMCASTICH